MAQARQRDLAPERHERLRGLLRERSAVRVRDLCRELRVSPATVRRDLEELVRRGELRRVHGGALSAHSALEEPLFEDKAHRGVAEKQRIAHAAIEYIQGGETIYLDGGSTVLELARLLRHRNDVTVVTNSVRAAQELASSGPRLILISGELRRLSQTLVGPLTRLAFADLHVDKAFMGTLGLTLEHGLTTTDPGEAFTKELAIRHAGQVILLMDASKVGKVGLSRAGALEDVSVLISDKGMERGFARGLRKAGIRVVLV
jgi:DeoR family fructose operon transcriptional repressor